jgi:hypothetical protein
MSLVMTLYHGRLVPVCARQKAKTTVQSGKKCVSRRKNFANPMACESSCHGGRKTNLDLICTFVASWLSFVTIFLHPAAAAVALLSLSVRESSLQPVLLSIASFPPNNRNRNHDNSRCQGSCVHFLFRPIQSSVIVPTRRGDIANFPSRPPQMVAATVVNFFHRRILSASLKLNVSVLKLHVNVEPRPCADRSDGRIAIAHSKWGDTFSANATTSESFRLTFVVPLFFSTTSIIAAVVVGRPSRPVVECTATARTSMAGHGH